MADYYLCIETNYSTTKTTPSFNNGYPKCVLSDGPPNYIRVLGPFAPFECEDNNLVPYYTKDGNQIDTTRGWYVVCTYNNGVQQAQSVKLDYPPIRTQYPLALGPFDTQAQADVLASQISCSRVYQEASDTCAPTPKGAGGIDICCSLLGSSLHWPYKSGTIQLQFYANICSGVDPEVSSCIPNKLINLGCKPSLDPTVQTCWAGLTDWFNVVAPNTSPPRGFTLRFIAEMCVGATPDKVNITVTMQWLQNPLDSNSSSPPENPIIATCGSFSAELSLVGTPTVYQARTYTLTNPMSFTPSCSFLSSCINWVAPSVSLLPMIFGCDGTADNGSPCLDRCSLDTGSTRMSCLQALVEPITGPTSGGWRPHFISLGVNPSSNTLENGCFTSVQNSGITYLQPGAKYTPANYIGQCGCPGDSVEGNTQQIQMGISNSFYFLLKRVNKGALCAAITPGYPAAWETATPTIIQTVGPWTAVCLFPSNNVKVTVYGFLFPPPLEEECPGPPATFSMTPPIFQMSAPPETPLDFEIDALQRQLDKMGKICLYLGNEIPGTKPCCGASPSYECPKHTRCKRYGEPGLDDQAICSSCEDFVQA